MGLTKTIGIADIIKKFKTKSKNYIKTKDKGKMIEDIDTAKSMHVRQLQRSRYVQIDESVHANMDDIIEAPPLSEKSTREILGLQTKVEIDRIVSGSATAHLAEQLKLMEHERKIQEMIHIKYMLQTEVINRRHRLLGVKVGFQAKLATLRNKAKQFNIVQKLLTWVDANLEELWKADLKRCGISTCKHSHSKK